MQVHRGNIVKSIVKQSGFSFVSLAKHLGISRSTLHNRFNTKNLPYEFIIEVGWAIGFDFSLIFDELKSPKSTSECKEAIQVDTEDYMMFLSHYSDLLSLTARTLVGGDSLALHERMIKLIQSKMLEKVNKRKGLKQ